MKTIVIAPYQMHKNLLSLYRGKDPFCNVKLMSKEELIGQYKGKVDEEAIKCLIKDYKYGYENALAVKRFLPFIDRDVYGLLDIKNNLIKKGLLTKNDYLNEFFKDSKIDIFGYSDKDNELIETLNHFSLLYRFVKNEKKKVNSEVIHYETIFDECFYTMNKIASLINDAADINKIYVLTVSSDYSYFLNKFAPSFGYKIDCGIVDNLYSLSLASRFLNQYQQSHDFESSKELISDCEDKELLDDFIKVVDSCYDPELSFESQLDFFVGELKRTKVAHPQYKDVVKLIDKPIFEKDAHIFVLGFSQSNFPKAKKDNELLSDTIKKEVGLNTSLEDAVIEKDIFFDFFYSDNHFYFSFADRSISDTFLKSPWIDELGMETVIEELPKTIFSKEMMDYYLAKTTDLNEFYSVDSSDYFALKEANKIPYGEYDNSYTGVNVYDQDMKLHRSYSNISEYYDCPFSYYLKNALNIDPFEDTLYTKLGKLAHKMFELHNQKDFDFDKTFEEEKAKFDFSKEEMPIINNLKESIRKASDAIKLHQRYMNNPQILTERKVSFDLGKNTTVTGIIDKAIILDDKYLVIVDYKTGNMSFEDKYIEDGYSLQLPIYCLLAKKDEQLSKYHLIGTFINNVINPKLGGEKKETDLIDAFYRLNGKVLADRDVISNLDGTLAGGKSEFIKSVKITKANEFAKSNSLASKEEFDYFAEVALRKLLEADTRIRNNDFVINPLFIAENKGGCTYCPYKDICYVKASQKRFISGENIDESEDDSDE